MSGQDGRDGPFNNPFAALKDKLGELPPGPERAKKVPPGPARAVVRMERKGRGGKEVTVVSQLELAPEALERWLKELKQSLGCGGAIEGDELVLQGDQRKRLPELLTRLGARKVTVG